MFEKDKILQFFGRTRRKIFLTTPFLTEVRISCSRRDFKKKFFFMVRFLKLFALFFEGNDFFFCPKLWMDEEIPAFAGKGIVSKTLFKKMRGYVRANAGISYGNPFAGECRHLSDLA